MTEEEKKVEDKPAPIFPAKAVKPGFKTTEFWMTSVAAVVGIILASGIPTDNVVMQVAGLAALVLSAFGYSVSRGNAKK